MKKVNVKNFLKKFASHNLMNKFFKAHNINDVPFYSDELETVKVGKAWFDFFNGLDTDDKLNIEDSLSKIAVYASDEGIKLFDSLVKADFTKREEKYQDTENLIIAQNNFDKAIAYFLDYFELAETVSFISMFPKLNQLKRFEAKCEIDDFDNVETVNILNEKFQDIYNHEFGASIVFDGRIVNHEGVVYAKFDYAFAGDKSLYFIFSESLGEIFVKGNASRDLAFLLCEIFVKKICANHSIDAKEVSYDLSVLLKKKKDNPLPHHEAVIDWQLKNIKMLRGLNTSMTFAFKKSDELKCMDPLFDLTHNMSLDLNTFQIESMSLNFKLSLASAKSGPKNISLSLKKNGINLNPLTPQYKIIGDILEKAKVFTGYKDFDLGVK
jgi:hypothetical protein